MFSDGHVEELLFNNLQIQLMPLFSVNMKMCMQLEDSQQKYSSTRVSLDGFHIMGNSPLPISPRAEWGNM